MGHIRRSHRDRSVPACLHSCCGPPAERRVRVDELTCIHASHEVPVNNRCAMRHRRLLASGNMGKKPASARSSCCNTELIGFVAFAKRGGSTLLAVCRPDCKMRTSSLPNKKRAAVAGRPVCIMNSSLELHSCGGARFQRGQSRGQQRLQLYQRGREALDAFLQLVSCHAVRRVHAVKGGLVHNDLFDGKRLRGLRGQACAAARLESLPVRPATAAKWSADRTRPAR